MTQRCKYCNSHSGLHTDPDKNWCFACHRKGKELINNLPIFLEVKKANMALPTNTGYILKEELEYLKKYNLKNWPKYKIFHSNNFNRLCFPYYKNNQMVGCWLRSLYTTPKWMYIGDKKDTYLWKYYKPRYFYPTENICLVEDVISAIRVSKFIDVICLGGIYRQDSLFLNELRYYQEVLIFLDGDKAGKEGAQRLRRLLKLQNKIRIIATKKDPKCYNDKELKEVLICQHY